MVIDPHALGSFGIQNILISLRLLATARVNDNCCVMAAVVRENARSLRNIESGGFQAGETPGWLKAAARGWCPEHLEVVNLVVPPQALTIHSRLILDLLLKPTRARPSRSLPGTLETVSIDLDIGWVHDEVAFLEKMAAGYMVGWATSIPHTGLLGPPGGRTEFVG